MGAIQDTRAGLVAAAKELLWDRGYETTSPRAIMDASGAGQGSFYHHFRSKKDLAAAALEDVSGELIAALDREFDPSKPALTRIEDWLRQPRNGLAGCRLGRMALEKSVIGDESLRRPLVRYFKSAAKYLRAALREAQENGELSCGLDCEDLAAMLLAVVQGGYVLSRAHRDADKILEATRAAAELLALHRTKA